jgi:uncharacterized protein (TIGR02300 family)
MSTVSARHKAMRGTKRTCQACEVRFYDLARSPIVCPSCGAHFTPAAAAPVVHSSAPPASFSSKTRWRSQPLKRAQPILPNSGEPSDPLIEEETEEMASVDSEDSVVLDQEQDEEGASGLVDHDAMDAEER